jgi:hypothetical protein
VAEVVRDHDESWLSDRAAAAPGPGGRSRGRILPLACLFGLALAGSAAPAGTAAPSAGLVEAALTELGFDASQLDELRAGKVLWTGLQRLEVVPGQIVVGTAVLLVRKPLHTIQDMYLQDTSFRINQEIVEFVRVDPTATREQIVERLRVLDYAPDERAEVDKLLRVRPGLTFNFSTEEIERFRALGETATSEQVSATYRDVLGRRLEAFQREGVSSIEPYQRRRSAVASPMAELQAAFETMDFVEHHFPDFHRALVGYPSARGDMGDAFYAIKTMASKRPTLVLAHRMAEHGDGYTVGGEVQFYVGHSYNSLLSLVGLATVDEGTLVLGVVRVFTDHVKGAGAPLKRTLGRRKVGRRLARHFERLRDLVESEDPLSK